MQYVLYVEGDTYSYKQVVAVDDGWSNIVLELGGSAVRLTPHAAIPSQLWGATLRGIAWREAQRKRLRVRSPRLRLVLLGAVC